MRDGVENYFEFGDLNTSDFGVYCSGGGTYSAPARDVDFYHVLGRDGDLIIDHGSHQNIEVTYPCWVARGAPDKIDAFRAALCSLRGYQKIVDPYHPNEYRMGVYKGSFMPEMFNANNDSANIEVVFSCKPQRFLDSGDTKTRIYSGDDVENPTFYNARPMIEAIGSGLIMINGEMAAKIEDVTIGDVAISQDVSDSGISSGSTVRAETDLSVDLLNSGDEITASGIVCTIETTHSKNIKRVEITNVVGCRVSPAKSGKTATMTITLDSAVFECGTSETLTGAASFSWHIIYSDDGSMVGAYSFDLAYSSATNKIAVSIKYPNNGRWAVQIPAIHGASSKSALTGKVYIDMDIGEAWIEEAGVITSVNNAVTLPAELPVIEPGSNTITFDNTITRLDIIPRWWTI